MERGAIDDFIRYAKEKFDCDIFLRSNKKPDTFEEIFGGSFLNQSVDISEVESLGDDLQYENISSNVYFSMESETEGTYDKNVGLAA